MTTDTQLDREMAFSRQPHANYACGDPYDPVTWCQRLRNHPRDFHAAGYGQTRRRWDA